MKSSIQKSTPSRPKYDLHTESESNLKNNYRYISRTLEAQTISPKQKDPPRYPTSSSKHLTDYTRSSLEKSFDNYRFDTNQSSVTKPKSKESEIMTRKYYDADDDEPNLTDIKLLNKELSATRKNLNETQARAISATKELSKVQHEYNMMQHQLKKTEIKCHELIDKHSNDQAKITELNYLNNQLQNELQKIKMETQENNSQTRENLEKLKKNLADVERLIEGKYQNVNKFVKKQKILVYTLKKIAGVSETDKSSSKLSEAFIKLEALSNAIVDTLSFQKLEDISKIEDQDDFDTLKTLNDIIHNYEKETIEQRLQINQLNALLKKEQSKSKGAIPQYRESINRLKNNSQLMLEKLKEIKAQRAKEQSEFNQKLKSLEDTNHRLSNENYSLKCLNNKLTSDLKETQFPSKGKSPTNSTKPIYSSMKDMRPLNFFGSSQKPKLEESVDEFMAYSTFSNPRAREYQSQDPSVSMKSRSFFKEDVGESVQLNNRDYSISNDTEFNSKMQNLNNQSVAESSKYVSQSAEKNKDNSILNSSYDANFSRMNQTDLDIKPNDSYYGKKRGNYNSDLPPRGGSYQEASRLSDLQTKNVSFLNSPQFWRNNMHDEGKKNDSFDDKDGKNVSMRGSARDLNDDIASLNHEIYEIQKAMAQELNIDF